MIRFFSFCLLLGSALALAQESDQAPVQTTGQTTGQTAADETAVFSPEPGYACDRKKQLCRYQEQPNFHMTHIQFGVDAAMKLLKDTPQIVDLKGGIFYPESNVSCDFSVQICYQAFQASVELTKHYFSEIAAERLTRFQTLSAKDQNNPIFDPMRGARCVRNVHICYDQKGPSVSLTRVFFGNDKAIQLLESLLKQQAATN